MSFKAFRDEEIQEILDHVLGCMPKETRKTADTKIWERGKISGIFSFSLFK